MSNVPELRAHAQDDFLDDLYRSHRDATFRLSYALLRDREEAEDALQETFLNAGRALARGTVPLDPRSWLLAIARNGCRQRLRERAERARDVPLEDELHALPDREGPRATEIREALQTLLPLQRDVLLRRELEGRPVAEIAAGLELSEGAVNAQLSRARLALREALENEEHPISCDEVPGLVTLHRDGAAAPSQRRLLRAHLRMCSTCATLARKLRAARPVFGLLPDLVVRAVTWLGRAGTVAKVAAGTGAAVMGMGVAIELSPPPSQAASGTPPVPRGTPRVPRPAGVEHPERAPRTISRTGPVDPRPAPRIPLPRTAPAQRPSVTPPPASTARQHAPSATETTSAPAPQPAPAASAALPAVTPPRHPADTTPEAATPSPAPPSITLQLPTVPDVPELPELPELPPLPPLPTVPGLPPPPDLQQTVDDVQQTVDGVEQTANHLLDTVSRVDPNAVVPPVTVPDPSDLLP